MRGNPFTVERVTYQDLEHTLNRIQTEGGEITNVVPHRNGREVVAEVVSRSGNIARRHWAVQASGYDELEENLNQLATAGYEIFEIIPHREGTKVFAEIVAYKEESQTSATS